MESALLKSKEHKPATKSPEASPQADQMSLGSSAGMPLFLQRAPLDVNEPDDIYEQEADRAAEQITNEEDSQLPIDAGDTPDIQRQAISSDGGMKAPANIVPSGGQALPATTRTHFEKRFGHDFSGVHVHADDQAAKNARSVNARAFTAGQDVVFGAGEYQPDTPDGQHLLAHELTHVIQQGGQRQQIQRQETPDGGTDRATSDSEAGANQSFGFSEEEMESRLSSTPPEGADTSTESVELESGTESTLSEVEEESGEEHPEEAETPEEETEQPERTDGGTPPPPLAEPPAEPPVAGPEEDSAAAYEQLSSDNVGAYLNGSASAERVNQLDPTTTQLLDGAAALSEREVNEPESSTLGSLTGISQLAGALDFSRAPRGYENEPTWLQVVARVREIAGALGGVVGTIGLVATVSGFILSLLIPPVGAFLLTVGRFCDIAALVLDAVSLACGLFLTGYNYYRLKNATTPEETARLSALVRQEAMNTLMSGISVATAVAPGLSRALGRTRLGQVVGRRVGGLATGAGRRLSAVGTRIAESGVGRRVAAFGRAAAGTRAFQALRRGAVYLSPTGRFHQLFEWGRRRPFIQRLNTRAGALDRFFQNRTGWFARNFQKNRTFAQVLYEGSHVSHHLYIGRRMRAALDNPNLQGLGNAAAVRQRIVQQFPDIDPQSVVVRRDASGRWIFGRNDGSVRSSMRRAEFADVRAAFNGNPNASDADLAQILNNRPNSPSFWTAEEIRTFRQAHTNAAGALNIPSTGTVSKTPHHTIPAHMAPHLHRDPRYMQLANAPVGSSGNSPAFESFARNAYPPTPITGANGAVVSDGLIRRTADAENLIRQGHIVGVTDPNFFRSPEFYRQLRAQGSTGRWVNPYTLPGQPPQTLLFDTHLVLGHRWTTGESVSRPIYGTLAEMGEELEGEATRRIAGSATRVGVRNVLPRTVAPSDSPEQAIDNALASGGAMPVNETTPNQVADAAAQESRPPAAAAPPAEAETAAPSSGPTASEASARFLTSIQAHLARPAFIPSGITSIPSTPGLGAPSGSSQPEAAPVPEMPATPPESVPYSPESLAQIHDSRLQIEDAILNVEAYIAATQQSEHDNQLAVRGATALHERSVEQQEGVAGERENVTTQQEDLNQAEGAQQDMSAENERASGEGERGQSEGESVQSEGQNVSVEAKPEEPEEKSWLERAWDATAGAAWRRLVQPAIRAVRRKVNQVMQSISEFIMKMINQALGLDEVGQEFSAGGEDIADRRGSFEESDASLEETGAQAEAEESRNDDTVTQAEGNIEEAQAVRSEAELLLESLLAHRDALLQEEQAAEAYISGFGSQYEGYFAYEERQREEAEVTAPAQTEPAEQPGDTVTMNQILPVVSYITTLGDAESAAGQEIESVAAESGEAIMPELYEQERSSSAGAVALFYAGRSQRESRLSALYAEAEACIGLPAEEGFERLQQIMEAINQIADELEMQRQMALQAISEPHLAASAEAVS